MKTLHHNGNESVYELQMPVHTSCPSPSHLLFPQSDTNLLPLSINQVEFCQASYNEIHLYYFCLTACTSQNHVITCTVIVTWLHLSTVYSFIFQKKVTLCGYSTQFSTAFMNGCFSLRFDSSKESSSKHTCTSPSLGAC